VEVVVEEHHSQKRVLKAAVEVVQPRQHPEQETVSVHIRSEHQSERSTQRTAAAGVRDTPHIHRTQHKGQTLDFAGSKQSMLVRHSRQRLVGWHQQSASQQQQET
jgi:hypothetical protein